MYAEYKTIPQTFETEILDKLRLAKASTHDVADWLRNVKHIHVPFMLVHEVCERLRRQFMHTSFDREMAELRARLPTHLRTVEALAEQYAELGRAALTGNSVKHVAPNPELARQLFAKQSSLIALLARLIARFSDEKAAKPAKKVEPVVEAALTNANGAKPPVPAGNAPSSSPPTVAKPATG